MSLIKTLEDLNISPFLESYKNIEDGIVWTEYPNGKQAGLQYIQGCDPWTDAVGRANPNKNWYSNVCVNPYFNGTVFETFINKYKLTRTRFMWAKPFTCYSMHKDDSPRVHLPLITDPNCYFVFKDEGLFHFEVGKAHWVDTTKEHTFINCSPQWRLHLLGAL